MKVLIVGVGRCGTTSLMNSFTSQNYFKISEPYNKNIWKKIKWSHPIQELTTEENIVIKTLIHQTPESYNKHWFNFIEDYIKYFDKVIWLDRKDIELHYESMIHLWYKKKTKQNAFDKWRMEDIPNEIIEQYDDSDLKIDFYRHKKEFQETINNLKQSVTWYEDLYGDDRNKSLDIIKSWNLNIDVNKMNQDLHPSKKLRQFGKKSVI